MDIKFFVVDRSITVGHTNGGYLYLLPDFIPFSFDSDELDENLYHLKGNRLHFNNKLVKFTGSLSGTFFSKNARLSMDFIFEDGLLKNRFLKHFEPNKAGKVEENQKVAGPH